MRNRTPDQNNNLVQPGPLLPCDVPEQFHLELRNIIAALVCLLTAMGIGFALLQSLARAAPSYWRCSLALLSGIAISDTFLTSALYLGGGALTLHLVSILLLAMGGLGIARHFRSYRFSKIFGGITRHWWLAAIVFIALSLNLFIALAPSTKIDELHYHMLVPKRVILDNGLRPYRQPFESAIFPQLSFQYALSAVYALGAPGAGQSDQLGHQRSLDKPDRRHDNRTNQRAAGRLAFRCSGSGRTVHGGLARDKRSTRAWRSCNSNCLFPMPIAGKVCSLGISQVSLGLDLPRRLRCGNYQNFFAASWPGLECSCLLQILAPNGLEDLRFYRSWHLDHHPRSVHHLVFRSNRITVRPRHRHRFSQHLL